MHQMQENEDQTNYEYGHFLHSDYFIGLNSLKAKELIKLQINQLTSIRWKYRRWILILPLNIVLNPFLHIVSFWFPCEQFFTCRNETFSKLNETEAELHLGGFLVKQNSSPIKDFTYVIRISFLRFLKKFLSIEN